jgi:hypothetical protein
MSLAPYNLSITDKQNTIISDHKARVYNQTNKISALKREYDELLPGDARRDELRQEIAEQSSILEGYVQNFTTDYYAIAEDLAEQANQISATTGGYATFTADTIINQSGDIEGFGGLTDTYNTVLSTTKHSVDDMGVSEFTSTTDASGNSFNSLDSLIDASIRYLENRTEVGVEAVGGTLQEGRDALQQGVTDATTQITEGETFALGEIDTAKREMLAAIHEGSTKLEGIGVIAHDEIIDSATKGGAAIRSAASTAGGKAIGSLQEGFSTAEGYLSPYTDAGVEALDQYKKMLGIGGDASTMMETLQATPGFQFSLQEGLKATNRSAAARGGALGGRALKELQRVGSGLASQTWGTHLAHLGGITETGSAASTTLANLGVATGKSIADVNLWQGDQYIAGHKFEHGGKIDASKIKAGFAELGTTTKMAGTGAAHQWAGQTRAGIATGAATAKAGITMQGAVGESGLFSQEAGAYASLYGTQATTGAGFQYGGGLAETQFDWMQYEANLATELAKWQGGMALWGDIIGAAGTIIGGGIQAGLGAGM